MYDFNNDDFTRTTQLEILNDLLKVYFDGRDLCNKESDKIRNEVDAQICDIAFSTYGREGTHKLCFCLKHGHLEFIGTKQELKFITECLSDTTNILVVDIERIGDDPVSKAVSISHLYKWSEKVDFIHKLIDNF